MKLIIGLGNPGEEYKKTRHNCGFMAVDKIAANFQFSIFNGFDKLTTSFQSIFNAKISKGKIANENIILVKPQTYMNNSGQAVKKLTTYYKLPTTNLIIIHDDLDLPLGKIRISKSCGAAGHKGVESIICELKTKDFIRLRIGINPKQYHRPVCGTEKFVLQKFNKEEEKIIFESLEKINLAVQMILEKGVDQAMNKYN
ncbi:aminoacyl-tRNA hydrolase [Candidatus Kuenenbacteria bacterium]|nr:aminoacyl-tRNA hydrolase [Candidatus Kuenenbacteria bacterium]